jgi:hypothetical protein
VTFKEAVEKTKNLEKAWEPGLQALRAEDRLHIDAEDTRKLRGSVDLDKAWQQIDPHGNRWDFGIAYQHSNRADEFVYWVELHTASDSQVKKVIKKAQWLLNWLKSNGGLLNQFEREIVWVSSGATTFTLNAPQKKQMALAALKHRGSKLRILNRCPG